MENIILFGLQRTGTNFLETLLKKNFNNLCFCNNVNHRSLPLHKHFRLYNEKLFIPESKYLNNFYYQSFSDFDQHVKNLLKTDKMLYVVNTKEPYSWYISYNNLAKRMKWKGWKKKWLNAHFMIDYNLFHKMWLKFAEESSNKVIIINYEEVLNNPEKSILKIEESFGQKRNSTELIIPGKVNMSKKFDDKRKSYYQSKEFLKELNEDDIMALSAHLEKEVVEKLGYQMM